MGTIDDGPTLPRFVIDARCSAYVHLHRLAERLGMELYADRDDRLMFHKPDRGEKHDLAYGRHLLMAFAAYGACRSAGRTG